MLTISPIRSSSGASEYFAADNYYTQPESFLSNQWQGLGAAELGLSGEVTPEALEAIFDGIDPTTKERITPDNTFRKGLDLPFSAPKNFSLAAIIGGDQRLIAAHEQAVRLTMAYAEKHFAAARVMKDGERKVEQTGKLVYALFTHDTNRNQEANLHTHATVANMTQTADGKWRALHNEQLYKYNTLLGAIYQSSLREITRGFGIETVDRGQNAQWDIAGVPEHITDLNSTRRAEIVSRAAELGVKTGAGRGIIALDTRAAKEPITDRAAWLQGEYEKNKAAGFDVREFTAGLKAREAAKENIANRTVAAVSNLIEKYSSSVDLNDPRVSRGITERLLTPIEKLRTEWAVASAINKLSEREAVFSQADIIKNALTFREAGVTLPRIEARIGQLTGAGLLMTAPGADATRPDTAMTTPESLRAEIHVVKAFLRGEGKGEASLSAQQASERLEARQLGQIAKDGIVLNAGQMQAAHLALSSPDRFVAVQGDAGTGKSTMVQAVSEIQQMVAGALPDTNKTVVGLASYNAMVKDLGESAQIASRTVQSFLHAYEKTARYGGPETQAAAREELKDKIFVVDESSVVGTKAMQGLVTIAETLGIEKMVFIGDRFQLAAIMQGKPAALGQDAGMTMSHMSENIRQANHPELVEVAALARAGQFAEAFDKLGQNFRESDDFVAKGVEHFLSLTPDERKETMIIVPGRALKDEVNIAAQELLKSEGALVGEGVAVSVLEQISKTREDLRYTASYQPGMVFELARNDAATGLPAGSYDVDSVNSKSVTMVNRDDGTVHTINPRGFSTHDENFQAGLYIAKEITIHAGEKIRWTNNDHDKGLFRSTEARIESVEGSSMTVVHQVDKQDVTQTIDFNDDKMGKYFDLAYAINADQAQGATAKNVIALMTAQIKALATRANAYVMMTREKVALWVYTDDRAQLEKTLEGSNPEKTSSLELNNGGPLVPSEIEATIAAAEARLQDGNDLTKADQADKGDPPAGNPGDIKRDEPLELRDAAPDEPDLQDRSHALDPDTMRTPDAQGRASGQEHPSTPTGADDAGVWRQLGAEMPVIKEFLRNLPERTRDIER